MVFNVTFNTTSVISWRSDLLAEETTDLSQVTDKLYHIMLYTSPWSTFKLTSVVMDSDYIDSCKSKYHTITATTVPLNKLIIIYICRNKRSGYVMLKVFLLLFVIIIANLVTLIIVLRVVYTSYLSVIYLCQLFVSGRFSGFFAKSKLPLSYN
jgi:hypothetical protein